jgi:hypothetical protein
MKICEMNKAMEITIQPMKVKKQSQTLKKRLQLMREKMNQTYT